METIFHPVRRWITPSLICLMSLPAFAIQPWQQEVNYQLDVTLDEDSRSITGKASVEYINNSPDTLVALWFRLPPAALQAGSYVDRFDFPEDAGRFSRLAAAHYGNLTTGSVTAEGDPADFDQDYSIGLLSLNAPLLPGDTTTISIPFTTLFPTGGASVRIGYRSGQFKGAYWYPMICPYTPQYGWTVNRYFGTGEAYGEFGDFDLRYTVPTGMIVASTGYLVNEAEVLPPARLASLSIDSPGEDPSVDGTETWHYLAENVPDVAFAMDRSFLIDRIDFGHYEAWSFVRRENKDKWAGVAELCGWTIEQLEDVYGPYPWPRVVATDSWSAMEYPMLTMMSGSLKGYEYVFIHEVVHNYTPMILHSNSVDVQALDEGFTTFVEHLLTKRWYKSEINRQRTYSRGLFERKIWVKDDIVRGAEPYLTAVLAGEDLPMVRGGDIAHDYPLLRVSSYYKTPVMLNALRYTIGDEAFFAGMRQYYSDNMLSHPDELDMIESFQKGARQPLGWFFKQFLYSSDDIDYAVQDVKFVPLEHNWLVEGRVCRKAGVRLPVRLGVVTTENDTVFGEIAFLQTDPPLAGYERWGSWDQLHEPLDFHSFSVTLPRGVWPTEVIVDPRGQLIDRYPLDNSNKRRSFNFRFDNGLTPKIDSSTKTYEVTLGPAVGWNYAWGVFPGMRVRGGYFERVNRFDGELYFIPKTVKKSPIEGRLWAAIPVVNLPDGVEASAYGGKLHGDRWFEAGLRAQWRTWGKRTTNHHASVTAGKWGRSAPWPGESGKEIPFLALDYKADYPKGIETGEIRARLTAGDSYDAFFVFEIESSQRLKVGKKWSAVIEARGMEATRSTPDRFRPGLGGASSFSQLGNPISGGPLNQRNPDGWRFAPGAPATMVHQSWWWPDRFVVLGFNLERNWARATATTPLRRLPGHFRTRLFETNVVYGWKSGPAETFTKRAMAEAGIEVGLQNLYGFDITLRSAIISLNLDPFETPVVVDEFQKLKQYSQFFVSYRLDRFYR